MLLDVSTRQNAVPRVEGTDRDLDMVVADARLRDVARVIHLERHVFERPVVARVQPAEAAEAAAASIRRGFVGWCGEERHAAVEREAAAVRGGVMLVPLEVAAPICTRATGWPGLEPERREIVRVGCVLAEERLGLVDAAAAGETEVGAGAAALRRWRDAGGDGALRTRGILARRGDQYRRDCTERQREMSRFVHESVPILSMCMLRARYTDSARRKRKAGASTRVLDTGLMS